jgi:5'-nucleotidase / UDP-sugar diphosphatase
MAPRTHRALPISSRLAVLGAMLLLGGGLAAPVDAAPANASEAPARASFHCPAENTCLNFVAFNDVYEWAPYPASREGTLSRVSTYLKTLRQQFPNAQVLFAGDTLSPSPESSVTQGRHMIESLNALGISVATLGNHELDFKAEGLNNALNLSKFPWLAANVKLVPGAPIKPEALKPYHMLQQQGKRILVFGLLTPETNSIAPVDGLLKVEDPIATTKTLLPKWVAAEKPDAVIALTHLNIAEDRQLAQEVPGIHLIIGGHDHHQIFQWVNGVPIIKLDSDARTIGHVQLNIPKVGGSVSVPKKGWFRRKERATSGVSGVQEVHYEVQALVPQHFPPDAAFEATIKQKTGLNMEALNQPLTTLPMPWPIYQEEMRNRYSPVGYSIAELLRRYTKTDVALVNGGGLRSNSTLEPGPITQRDVLQILPFENPLVQVNLTGSQLMQVVRYAYQTAWATPNWGGYPHIAGLVMVMGAGPNGQPVLEAVLDSATQQPVPPTKVYRLTTNDYLVQGGNGYPFPAILKAGASRIPLVETQAQGLGKALRTTPPAVLQQLMAQPPNVQVMLQPAR